MTVVISSSKKLTRNITFKQYVTQFLRSQEGYISIKEALREAEKKWPRVR